MLSWIMELPTGTAAELWFIRPLILIGALLALGWFLHRVKHLHLVTATPTAKIRSAPQGYIEIKGRAMKMPGPDIIAPLSRQDCVWFAFRVLGHSQDQTLSTGLERGSSDALFWVEDETGRCIIDPDGAKVEPSQLDRWYGDTQRPEIKAFGWMYDWFGRFHHRVEYLERRIHSGDELYVLGEFHSMDTERQQVLNQDISAILRSWKNDPQRMRSLDKNKDGRIDNEEWQMARQSADRAARHSRAERGAEDAVHILRKPQNSGLPFIISTRSENKMIRYYKLQALTAAVLFILFITLWLRLYA